MTGFYVPVVAPPVYGTPCPGTVAYEIRSDLETSRDRAGLCRESIDTDPELARLSAVSAVRWHRRYEASVRAWWLYCRAGYLGKGPASAEDTSCSAIGFSDYVRRVS